MPTNEITTGIADKTFENNVVKYDLGRITRLNMGVTPTKCDNMKFLVLHELLAADTFKDIYLDDYNKNLLENLINVLTK